MYFHLLIFVAGLLLLLQGAHYLVDGSVNIARRFKISRLVIGLTVIAVGTSAPEMTVNVISAIQGHSEIVFSNVSGSNILNILLILGLTAVMAKINIDRKIIVREFPFLIVSSIILFAMVFDTRTGTAGILHPAEGLILLALLVLYLIYLYRESSEINDRAVQDKPEGTVLKNALFLFMGLIGLTVGAQLMVDSAVSIAVALGVSSTLVAVTVIALGTSLPELASSFAAVRRNETDLALGNIIGSNIFNTLAVVGVSSLVIPGGLIPSAANLIDIGISLGVSLLLFLLLLIINKSKRKQFVLSRWEGLLMLTCLAMYLAYVVSRG